CDIDYDPVAAFLPLNGESPVLRPTLCVADQIDAHDKGCGDNEQTTEAAEESRPMHQFPLLTPLTPASWRSRGRNRGADQRSPGCELVVSSLYGKGSDSRFTEPSPARRTTTACCASRRSN